MDLPSSDNRLAERWLSPFEELLGSPGATAAPAPGPGDIRRPESVVGTPGPDSRFWDGRQNHPDTCAVRCQEYILQQYTGVDINEDLLVREAAEHGWYTPGGGTPVECVGNLLELHGIAVNRFTRASVFHLANELAQGHKVIVGVRATDLWTANPGLEEVLGGTTAGADHAVVVSGIDTADPDHVRVIVSDPGTGDVRASYPLERFLDAWRDSDFFMVATCDPAPPHLPEMARFDYGVGHIPRLADLTYDQFLTLADRPEVWEAVVHHFVECSALLPVDVCDGGTPELIAPDPAEALPDLLPDLFIDESAIDQSAADGHEPASGVPDDILPSDWA